MHAAIAARGNQVVDVHVPQAGGVGGAVFLEQALEFAHLRDGCPAQTEARGDTREIAAAVHGAARIDLVGTELVELGAVSAVVQNGNQHLDALAADRLQLLDVHVEAAVAFDQHDLAVTARGRYADRARQSLSRWHRNR